MDLSWWLRWLEGTALAARLRESALLFPLLESMHVIGLALVLGTIAVLDLRLLGVASTDWRFRQMSADVLKWTWGAFAATVATGVLMFVTNATVYSGNTAFRLKLVLLALAGLNVAVFELTAGRSMDRWDRLQSAPPAGRAAAVISLALWMTIVVAGRVIGFTTTRATLEPPQNEHLEELLGFPP
jgi:hypothetical protein